MPARDLESRRSRGITVLELLVVASIAAILAAAGFAVPAIKHRARVEAARARIQLFATAESMVCSQTGRYTTTLQELAEARSPAGFGNCWDGPYLRCETTIDPWGNPYFYSSWRDGNAPLEHEGHPLWDLAMRTGPILDTGPLPRYTGQPLQWFYNFGARRGRHLIRVFNNGITSAWVTINGVQVIDPNEFKKQIPWFTVMVDLEDVNDMDVRIASGPGNFTRVVVETYVEPALPSDDLADEGLGWWNVFGGSPKAGFLLGSYGADGAPGGTGFAADIIYGSQVPW